VFDEPSSSYFEIGTGWSNTPADDGWWLDDIRVSGTVVEQFSLAQDFAPRTGTCPTQPNFCNEAVGDKGTNVVLKITDLAGTILDGSINVASTGQSIHVSAINSTIPGGCVGGVAEYEFSKDGTVVQAFGPKTFYLDAPEATTNYSARCRCSTDFSCTSVVGATTTITPYSGDGSDGGFGIVASPLSQINGVQYFRGLCIAPSPNLGAPCNQGVCLGGVGGTANNGIGCNSSAVCTGAPAGTCASVIAECGAGGVCDATAATANDTTKLNWFYSGAAAIGSDLLRGTVPTILTATPPAASPAPKGARAGAFWNFTGIPAPALPAVGGCFLGDRVGTFVVGPPAGSNYTSGNLSQAADANPVLPGSPLSSAVIYYTTSRNAPGGPGFNVNSFSCETNASICSNAGWCELGTEAGKACDIDANCAGAGAYCATNRCTAGPVGSVGKGCNTDAQCGAGGVCGATAAVLDPVAPTFCRTDGGFADLGGCGRHGVCAAGTFANRICILATDCPGSTCTLVATPTNGAICYNNSDGPINKNGCPTGAISYKRLDRQLAPGGPLAYSCP